MFVQTEAAVAAAASSNGHLLEIADVVREYPVTAGAILQRKVNSVKAVSGVSLHVDAGEALGLVGESGCGKTTLGQADRRRREARRRAGSRWRAVSVFRMRGRGLRRARRDLQMMFQDPYASLDPRMRVQAILREPLVIQSVGQPQGAGRRRSGSCSTRSGCLRTRSSDIRTSSPAASASGSRSPGR